MQCRKRARGRHVSRWLLAMFFSLGASGAASAADRWEALSFAPGWTNYENGYRAVSAAVSDGTVTVTGLAMKVGGGSWGHIATLPPGMRPPAVMTFNVNTHDRISRVDVRPDGQIVFNEGQTSYGWVSLDGISFPLGPVGRIDVGAGYAD
jgi:hypothetical protein